MAITRPPDVCPNKTATASGTTTPMALRSPVHGAILPASKRKTPRQYADWEGFRSGCIRLQDSRCRASDIIFLEGAPLDAEIYLRHVRCAVPVVGKSTGGVPDLPGPATVCRFWRAEMDHV